MGDAGVLKLTFTQILNALYFSISAGLALYIIYCVIWFFLYGKKLSDSIGDDIALSAGLIFIPLLFAIESKTARTAIVQSFFIFCIGAAFICLRQAYFRIMKAKYNKYKCENVKKQNANKGNAKRNFIRAKTIAFVATRRRLK